MIIKQNTTYAIGNVLGQVDIPRDYDADTLAIEALSAGVTLQKKNKLDDFITSLKTANLWGKISTLIVPAFFDVKDDAFIDVKNKVKLAVNSADNFNFTQGVGVICPTTQGTITLNQAFDRANFHLGNYNVDVYTENASGMGKSELQTSNIYLGRKQRGAGGQAAQPGFIVNVSSGVPAVVISNEWYQKGLLIGSANTSTIALLGSLENNYLTSDATSITTQSITDINLPISSGLNRGLITIGTFLTEAEMRSYRSIINTFMA